MTPDSQITPKAPQPYPGPDHDLIPLVPPILPHLIRLWGRTWVVERTKIEDLVTGDYQRQHGGLVHERSLFLGKFGFAELWVPRDWHDAWAEARAQEAEEEEWNTC